MSNTEFDFNGKYGVRYVYKDDHGEHPMIIVAIPLKECVAKLTALENIYKCNLISFQIQAHEQ